tara:strand:+ start:846 stop:1772 length:927 start_codon:yes stop_codon:yes gene_type:complete
VKKIFLIILLSFFLIEKANSGISDSLFMTVGNKAITKSDVVNEIKILLILNNESYSDEKREQLQDMAIKSIIKRSIKKSEVERVNFLKFNQDDLNMELKKLANKINLDLDTLKNICASNELDFLLVEDQIKIELMWNSLIFEIYKNRLSINQEEIEEQIKLFQNKKNIEEYLISEILLPPIEKDKIKNEIQNLKKEIAEKGFENVARDLSISESSVRGGDLGWINENIISKKIKSSIINTTIGEISEPIILQEGILLFQVRSKRNIENELTLEQTKNQLVQAEKIKILNMYSLTHYDKLRRSVTVKFF